MFGALLNKPNNPMPGVEQHKLVQASPIKLTPGDQQHRRVHASPTTKCQAACSKGKPNKQALGKLMKRMSLPPYSTSPTTQCQAWSITSWFRRAPSSSRQAINSTGVFTQAQQPNARPRAARASRTSKHWAREQTYEGKESPALLNKPNKPMPGLEQHKLVQASPIKLTPGDQQHRRVHASPTTKCQAACSKGKLNKRALGQGTNYWSPKTHPKTIR